VRTKVLKIALNMITSKNVEHFISVLEKELKNTVEQDYEKVRRSPRGVVDIRTLNIDNYLFIPYILVLFNIQKWQQAAFIF